MDYIWEYSTWIPDMGKNVESKRIFIEKLFKNNKRTNWGEFYTSWNIKTAFVWKKKANDNNKI